MKFATNTIIYVNPTFSTPQLTFAGSDYRPIVCTAKDDDSIGETISGSTGTPTNFYANTVLNFAGIGETSITNLRVLYARQAIGIGGGTINVYDSQFVNGAYSFVLGGANLRVRNTLLANNSTNFVLSGSAIVDCQNASIGGSKYLATASSTTNGSAIALTNCILANVTNLGFGVFTSTGAYNAFYGTSPSSMGLSPLSLSDYPFQSSQAGNYYLSNSSPCRNAGTTNIEFNLSLRLAQKTTYAPILLSNLTWTVDSSLGPQAQRDIDQPDLGYHYAPLDYIVMYLRITNSLLSVLPGTAIAAYYQTGIWLQEGAGIVCQGTPTAFNHFCPYSCVQEQPIRLGSSDYFPINPFRQSAVVPGVFGFTDFSTLAGNIYQLDIGEVYGLSPFTVRDCTFSGGNTYITGGSPYVVDFENNVFERSAFYAEDTPLLTLHNNLFRNSNVWLDSWSSTWTVKDNMFDNCNLGSDYYVSMDESFNAYQGTSRLSPTNANDVLLTNFTFVAGPLGNFYQPSTSSLMNVGSRNATNAGLYHYTVTTNLISSHQIKETNSIVDIGFHYVAVDSNGIPLDQDGDGLADYLENTRGDGGYNAGDLSNWNSTDTDGDGVDDFTEYRQGRNPRVAGVVSDTNNVIHLNVYTPLK